MPGVHPDVWFDSGDLTAGSIILIRRESITCCGFLGGDSIQIIRSGAAFADLLEVYQLALPHYKQNQTSMVPFPDLLERKKTILHALLSPGQCRDKEPAEAIPEWIVLISRINDTVWFSSSSDPFRYELTVLGDIHSFLRDSLYPQRLVKCLHWWYKNEATPGEQDTFPGLLLKEKLTWPAEHDLIIRAVNLYNHGAYEISGFI